MNVVLKVLLFASLRERAGWSERSLPFTSGVATAREVWNQLNLGPLEGISIAVNKELVGENQPLQAGDELAFLPPFTGG
ncbi:molydbenum cofactor biosynthesis protein D (molybdopterin converting factor small subunit) [Synechococcus sp. KORDI-52]|uniref:MoaD/ThiS family protein n=1 Tax=Synechococcus sp. KORDI-52 TaxID=585425 RepID=UPI0004E0AD92|nr:MoaD/ThiS family protein [Synechococcus sp. KORDI-52]AII48070.1 molydbenum cofactor biosynthesis protein D (molybdopterin converting factor small subunit) [Synechococcus sp. KORDI-52]